MKLVCNTDALRKAFSIEKAIEMIADAGFDAIDFSFFENYFCDKDCDNAEFEEEVKKIRNLAEEKGVSFVQAHAPFPSSTNDPAETAEIFENIVRSMKVASMLGIEYIVVHPMQHLKYEQEGNREKLFEMNMDFYKRLEPYCEKYNIKVALENMWQNIFDGKIGHSVCSRPEEFIRYLDTLNSKWFVACLDVGHAVLVCENPAAMVKKLGKRLACLHVHDVDGVVDSHTLPYFGITDWDSFTKALKEIGYTGNFTYEAGNFITLFPKELYFASLKFENEMGRCLIKKITD